MIQADFLTYNSCSCMIAENVFILYMFLETKDKVKIIEFFSVDFLASGQKIFLSRAPIPELQLKQGTYVNYY